MGDRAKGYILGRAKRNDFMGMIVDHGMHIGTLFVDRAMDEPFAIGRAVLQIDRLAIELEFHEIVAGNQFRRAGPRHEITFRIVRRTNADMTKGIDHPFTGQYPIGDNQFGQTCHQRIHLILPLIFHTMAAP